MYIKRNMYIISDPIFISNWFILLGQIVQDRFALFPFIFSYKAEPWEEIYTAHEIGKCQFKILRIGIH